MYIIAIGHAANRLKERNITFDDIRHALANIQSTWTTKNGSIEYQGPGVSGDTLKVWLMHPGYIDEDTTITLKSAAWKS